MTQNKDNNEAASALIARQVADWTKERDRLQDLIDAASGGKSSEAASAPDLRAVLIEVQNALNIANEQPNGPISDTIWMPARPETLFDFIESAIEAASASQSSTAGAAKGGNTKPNCRMQGGICACRSGGSFGGCAIERGFTTPFPDASETLAHVARQRKESAPLVAEAIEHAARICESHCACDNGEDDREVNGVLRARAAQIRGLLDTKKSVSTPSAAVVEGVDTALPDLSAGNWGGVFHTAFRHAGDSRHAAVAHSAIESMSGTEWGNIVDYMLHGIRAKVATYGAQQRESGRRRQMERIRLIEGQRDIAQATCREFSKALDEAELARQPVSEGLTLAQLDGEFSEEIKRVSSLDYPADSMCRAFYDNLRKRVFDILSAVPPAKAEGLTSPAWLSEPAEPGTYWFAQGAEFPPVIVHLVSNFDGEIGVVSKYETGMGKAERFAPASSCQGLWSKIDAPRLPSSASAKQGLTAFSCAKAVPNSAFAACDKFCGNNETCILAQQAKGETK